MSSTITTAPSKLKVVSAATAGTPPLLPVSVQTVLDELGETVGANPARDARVQRKIQRTAERWEKFTGRVLAFQKYRERVPGFADDVLVLNRIPVVEVTRFEFIPSTTAIEFPAVSGADELATIELIDPAAGFIRRRSGFQWDPMIDYSFHKVLTEYGNPVPGTEDPNYLVEYEAGWLLPDQNGPAASGGVNDALLGEGLKPIPADIEEGIVEEVIFSERNRLTGGAGGASGGVKSKTVDNTSISFATSADLKLAEQAGFKTATAFYSAQRYRLIK